MTSGPGQSDIVLLHVGGDPITKGLAPGDPPRVVLTGPATFGRARSCEVVIQSGRVSREHMIIEPRADGWWVRDLGAGQGTMVNGAKVREHRLQPGDKIFPFACTFIVESV